MRPDNLVTFRAAHPSVVEAIANCERPDWIIRLAFDAARNRRAVITHASGAARLLTRTKLRGPTELFIPWPGALEAVNAWAANTTGSRSFDTLRAYGVAALPATVAAVLVDWLVVAPQRGPGLTRVGAFNVVLVLSVFVFAQIAQRGLALVVRRRVSRLDEETAMSIVVEMVADGMVRNPARVPGVVATLRRKFGELLAGGNMSHESSIAKPRLLKS